MNTEVFSRITTLEGVDCLVCIFRKEMPEKRLLLIWNVIIPNRSAVVPTLQQCNRWADECFGTEEQMYAISTMVMQLKQMEVDNNVFVALPGTPVQQVAQDFEITARKA